jgi:SAM-dependent methyltransferase
MIRKCPFCSSSDYQLLRKVEKWGGCQDVAKCKNCGFVYVVTGDYYTFEYQHKFPDAVQVRRRHFHIKRLFDKTVLPNFNKERISIVEVGSGLGGLAKLFSEDSRYHYTGFEPNAERANFCKAKGLPVREEIFTASQIENKVQGIIFDNVLEHVEDPVGLLEQGAEVLGSGGVMVVLVPNLWDIRQLIPSWRENHHWMTHIHINYFTVKDLKYLFADNQMKLYFFGFNTLSLSHDLPFILRVLPDVLGIHLLGLNCYGVKR